MNSEELFEKLIKNQISREEFERLLEGIEDEDVLARYEVYLRQHFEKEVEQHFLERQGRLAAGNKLDVIINNESDREKQFSNGHKTSWSFPYAAVFVIFIGLLFSALFIISQIDPDSGDQARTNVSSTPQLITKSTPWGKTYKLDLEDGSFVHLNATSSIVYPNRFDEKSNREVEIKGEAYFDINRDEKRPFFIKVKDYAIQVLGTSFNIQAYEDEEDFSVTVESGKVRVKLDEQARNSIFLEKDQKLMFNPTTNITEIVKVRSDDELSWRKGILQFKSTPMAKVEKTLERWYGIDLVIADQEIYEKTLTGFHQNENLKSVLEALTYATGTTYEIKGKSIIINN